MNKPWIETHLREALEELEETLRQLDDPEFTEIEFRVAMEHAYNHLNTAWNSREESLTANHTMEQFYRWRAFPTTWISGLSVSPNVRCTCRTLHASGFLAGELHGLPTSSRLDVRPPQVN